MSTAASVEGENKDRKVGGRVPGVHFLSRSPSKVQEKSKGIGTGKKRT